MTGRRGDWRQALVCDVSFEPAPAAGGNPLGWPGYQAAPALRWGTGTVTGQPAVVCRWDFAVHGGSFGTADADAFTAACAAARRAGRPLVSLVRSGGTRLQEGLPALVGIPRAVLALQQLAAARLPHLAVADRPSTGGVLVAVVAGADLRAGVAGGTVGFAGPRVVAATTGQPVPAGGHTAESAAAAGWLDAVLPPARVAGWLAGALAALAPAGPLPPGLAAPVGRAPARDGWAQVRAAREADRPAGARLLAGLLTGSVPLTGGDTTVRAVVGRSAADRPTVGVAVAADRGGRPTPAGYRLLSRAARLADRVGADLLTLVDTPGAEPGPASEAAGLTGAIRDALTAVLDCRSPTLCLLHGEGGSGGALAAAVTDEVLVGEHGYFAALVPEGAAAALRITPAEAANRLRLTPADLVALGLARPAPAEPAALAGAVAARLHRLAVRPAGARLSARRARWSGPLPGRLSPPGGSHNFSTGA